MRPTWVRIIRDGTRQLLISSRDKDPVGLDAVGISCRWLDRGIQKHISQLWPCPTIPLLCTVILFTSPTLPLGLCTGCFLCLEGSSPRDRAQAPHTSFTSFFTWHLLRVFPDLSKETLLLSEMMELNKFLCIMCDYLPSNCIFVCHLSSH